MNARRWRATLWVALVAALPTGAQAAEATAPAAPGQDTARIDDRAGQQVSGRIGLNQAAGSGNAQLNLAAIAVSTNGVGGLELQSRQRTSAGGLPVDLRRRYASARIQGHAFDASNGLLSINQAAGSGNQQTNLFAIGQGIAVLIANDIAGLDDAALAAVAGDQPTEGADTPSGAREAVIADGAFRGSQGVVQINQTAGVGNISTNAIVLQLPGGAP